MNLDIKKLQNQWYELEIEKIDNENPKNNKRRYIHFDFRPSNIEKKSIDFVWKPDIVVRHSFYPFIKNTIVTRRKKADSSGIRRLSPKPRPISYASHKDSLLFSWYNYYLGQLYEEKIKDLDIKNAVIAYRTLKKSSVDFAKDVFDFIKNQSNSIVLCFDIHGFFDHLDHKILKNKWKEILGIEEQNNLPPDHYAIYKALTKYSTVELKDVKTIFKTTTGRYCPPEDLRNKLSKTGLIKKNKEQFGIPQGSPISAGASNFYMLDFDRTVNCEVDKLGGLYRRYSDDIIVVVPFSESDDYKKISDNLESFIMDKIKEQKLEIQKEKTEKKIFKNNDKKLECVNFDLSPSKVQYLGIIFDGLNLDLRGSTWSRYHRKLSKFISLKTYRFIKNDKKIFPKKQIYERFSDFGDNNIIGYAKNAERILQSKLIRKKTTKHRLIGAINKKIKIEVDKQTKRQNYTH
ncbi:MAG: reverse transcriptase domain-containing protein [Patescibacteria group bacterium]|nr:reverse transcriptase domain-containing protein [Patescibacteria group bacterium]